ncbi:hypothetical protein AYO47_04220 [Planctomyces sp. SCGC AG-212-M04]|nr:hypothetical protein AYO47_04220 [Planctomyces sp. SCGC AG-212-M04]
MSAQTSAVDSSPRLASRTRWLPAALIGIVILAAGWWRRAPSDPQLVGRWEWSPDPEAGSPMQLNGNGFAQVTVSIGCLSFPRTCRWVVEGDELKLYSTAELESLTLDGARKYMSDFCTAHFTTPGPIRRYHIVDRTGDELRLQPLWSDGSLSDAAVEVYQRTAEQ